MRLFIDTEFTDFIECELISIGIVADDGREFYAERNDFDLSKCSDFVKAAVLPQLGKGPAIVGTEEEIGHALKAWIAPLGSVEVCIDYAGDWELFCGLVRDRDTLTMPSNIACTNIASAIDTRDIEDYWRKNGRCDHHALHDARANRYAFACLSHKPAFVFFDMVPGASMAGHNPESQ